MDCDTSNAVFELEPVIWIDLPSALYNVDVNSSNIPAPNPSAATDAETTVLNSALIQM